MTISTIGVTDMHCAACADRVRSALASVPDIRVTHINPVRRQVVVEHAETTEPLTLLTAIETAGFSPVLAGLTSHDTRQRDLLKRLGIAGLAMMQVMMAAVALYAGALEGMEPSYERLLEHVSLLFTIPVVCYAAVPFFSSALTSLRRGQGLSMDVPIALAISIAFVVSLAATITGEGEVYYDSVVMFTFLLLAARYIDTRLQHRFDLSGQLLAALPRTALVESEQGLESRPVTAIEPGDRIWVGEGDQVPVDGVLQSKAAALDEAVLTGESDLATKTTGAPVYAGTINRGAGFGMRATHRVDDTRLAGIAALADQADVSGTRIARITDRVAGIFIPAVLTLATLTFLGWQLFDPERALVAALTVLVVSCPCALSLATPAALTAAMTRLRQIGVVLTSSRALEAVSGIDRIYLDKTGTLTMREPRIERIECLDSDWPESRCLATAAALEKHSSHPYARAFAHIRPDVPVADVRTVAGQGVEGSLDGQLVRIGSAAFAGASQMADRAVHLSVDGRVVARFEIADSIRPDARDAITALKAQGVEPIIVSGDNPERCRELAEDLGIDYLSGQSPEQKLAAIRYAQSQGHRILMVGDGINDIPVLAGADVSAAVVEASDLVKSRADVLLLGRRLGPLLELLRLGTNTRKIIRQNLAWAVAYNVSAIPVAALGFMPPWLAALGMAGSSILVMTNALRLLEPGHSRTPGLRA